MVNRCDVKHKKNLGVTLVEIPVIITGAGGRIGRMLRHIWQSEPPEGLRPIWVGRGDAFDITWDILQDPLPVWPEGAVVLHLAGVIRGEDAALRRNSAMIAPILAAAAANGARALLFASTAAVYPPGPDPLLEDAIPAPPNAYGAAKLAAEQALRGAALPVAVLRLGNVAGAESLLAPRPGVVAPVVLDPVPGATGGPLRSWIGPITLAQAFACLCRRIATTPLPEVINLVQSPSLRMADLLEACGRDWHYGAPNPQVVPAVVLSAERLSQICPLPPASPQSIAAEIRQLSGPQVSH